MGKFTIDVPPGHSVIKSGENCYRVVDVSTEHLPTTWEEFCKRTNVSSAECRIGHTTSIIWTINSSIHTTRNPYSDKCLISDKKTAEAFLALIQLTQLKKCYNGAWEPDWDNLGEFKYVIMNKGNQLSTSCSISVNYVLSFRTEPLRDHFLACFRDLIETAKSLI